MDLSELQDLLFSEDFEVREKGLLEARKLNEPKSYLMIKALAKWDPVNGENARELLKEFKIPVVPVGNPSMSMLTCNPEISGFSM